jgi:hypothetical protein
MIMNIILIIINVYDKQDQSILKNEPIVNKFDCAVGAFVCLKFPPLLNFHP